MPYLEIDGQPVRLPADASVQMDLKSPLLSDVLEESYAPELVMPTEGNEAVLGHVHELALAERKTILERAVLGHQGVPMHRGEVDTLGSTPKEVRAAFVLEGFLRRIKGITLPDALKSTVIDMVAENITDFHLQPLYSAGGRMQFPMHSNPSLYPSEARPYWNPSASDWISTATYSQDNLIRYTEYGVVKRTNVWVCIDPAGTSAGESPDTAPSKWARAAFGVVNAWDASGGTHYFNTVGNEFYCFVPWFYLKWVLTRALAFVGYTPVGEWMDDTTWDEWQLANTTTIDAAREQTSINYFESGQNTAATFNGTLSDFKVPGDIETPAPNQDPDGVWDPATYRWECPGAGTFRIVARTTINRHASGTPGRTQRVKAQLWDSTGALRGELYLAMTTPWDRQRWADFSLVCGLGDVGLFFHVIMMVVEEWSVIVVGGPDLPQSTVLWPTVSTDAYTESYVRGWKENNAPAIATPNLQVEVHRHMADVELGGFIQAIKDAWNLEVTPDEATKTVRFDYREQVVANAAQNTSDHSHRQVDEIELDHERATKGVTLKHDMETHEEDAEAVANAGYVYSESDLLAPTTTGTYVVLRSTRELMKSVFRNGVFVWEKVGYHVPEKTVGDALEADTVTMALVPLPMITQRLDGEEYLVPLLDAEGTSAWFNCEGKRDTLWIAEYKKSTNRAGDVTDVPSARCWGYGWDADDVSRATLLFDDVDIRMRGLYQRCFRLWLAMLIAAEPVKMDLRIDPAFLLGKEWKRILHIHSQRYLVQSMPVDYGPEEELVCEKAQLLRLRSLHAPQPPSTAAYVGVDTLRLFSYESELYFEVGTDTGYLAVHAPGGTTTVFGPFSGSFAITGTMPRGTPSGGGWWSFWPCDEDGNRSGNFLQFRSAAVRYADLPDMPLLDWLALAHGTLTEVELPALPSLLHLDLEDNAIADTDRIVNAIDPAIMGIDVHLEGGTNAPLTSLSETQYNTLVTDNGGTITSNP